MQKKNLGMKTNRSEFVMITSNTIDVCKSQL